jgi:hypothetical protein
MLQSPLICGEISARDHYHYNRAGLHWLIAKSKIIIVFMRVNAYVLSPW